MTTRVRGSHVCTCVSQGSARQATLPAHALPACLSVAWGQRACCPIPLACSPAYLSPPPPLPLPPPHLSNPPCRCCRAWPGDLFLPAARRPAPRRVQRGGRRGVWRAGGARVVPPARHGASCGYWALPALPRHRPPGCWRNLRGRRLRHARSHHSHAARCAATAARGVRRGGASA